MGRRLMTITSLILLLSTGICYADSIVLKDGTKVDGVVANSELIKSGRIYSQTISILVGQDLMRIPIGEIDYLTIGEGVDLVVIDPGQTATSRPLAEEYAPGAKPELNENSYEQRMKRLKEDRTAGIILTVIGLAGVVVGLAVPFGDEKITITADTVDYDEKSMNTLNWIMVGGGAAAAIGGITLTTTSSSKIEALQKEYTGVQVSWAF